MKKRNIKKLAILVIAINILFMLGLQSSLAQDEKSQTAQLTIANGQIAIAGVPEDFSFDPVFLGDSLSATPLYKTLDANNSQSILRIKDTDESGRNFKVTMSVSNFTNNGAIIPFTSFAAVTLAKDTNTYIDKADEGTLSVAGITAPRYCEWAGSNGNPDTYYYSPENHPLALNCLDELTSALNKFRGSGSTIAQDPIAPVSTAATTLSVNDSTAYNVGEVIVMGSLAMENLEYLIVRERVDETTIRVHRGVSETVASEHDAGSGITRWGNLSDEIDIFVAPEPDGGRIGFYSVGLGLRTVIEPNLDLVPGNYTGSINFTLYECNDLSCI